MSIAQWRLDFFPPQDFQALSEAERQILAVSQKILTRGRLTLCSPFLEDSLARYADSLSALPAGDSDAIDKDAVWVPHLDSPAERLFYDLLLMRLGRHFSKWIVPQIDISSLLEGSRLEKPDGRVDFLVSHPEMALPVIIEINGAQHRSHVEGDRQRHLALQNGGYQVEVLWESELTEKTVNELVERLGLEQVDPEFTPLPKGFELIKATKFCHQLQMVVIQAIGAGILRLNQGPWRLFLDPTNLPFDSQTACDIAGLALEDLEQLISNLGHLYSFDTSETRHVIETVLPPTHQPDSILVSYANRHDPRIPTFNIADIALPFHIANEVTVAPPASLVPPDIEALEYFLKYIFRKEGFWEGQADAIARALEGKDSMVLLPTGGGKSIAFQLASLLLPGRTVVIDPILSLIEDQIDNLASYGIDRCIGISSQIIDPADRSKAMTLFGQGEYVFAYIAPERFQTVEFREAIRALTVHSPVSLVAIDEAHCISEWGHDFRTSYLNIGRTTRQFCEFGGRVPPLLALTGTASRAVLKDMQRELQIEDFEAIITPRSFDRKELRFNIIFSRSSEKMARLKGLLGQRLPSMFNSSPANFLQANGHRTYSGLVFCPHVNGEYGVVDVAEGLRAELGIPTAFYAGKEPRYWSQDGWRS
ncbi:MAG: DEAD/DEAH box helicase, partial [Bacillota bacterium]|nr:DEAD/DEAH box helicase [Bacillota bacterium]